MKLFKKLAAVALAAVLALSMVGCGKAGGGNSTKQLVMDLLSDYASMQSVDVKYTNTATMDSIAQNLLNEAAAAYNSDAQTNKSVDALIETAIKKDVGFAENTGYRVAYTEDYQFKSDFITEAQQQLIFGQNLMSSMKEVGTVNYNKDMDVGVATGKIGTKTYVVVVMTETATAETTPKV